MKIGPSSTKPHPAIVAEASAWFVEFRAGDVHGEARERFIDWLRRSPEHIQAYLEISGAWAELPTSDPEGKIDIAALMARARGEADVVPLSGKSPPPTLGHLSVSPEFRGYAKGEEFGLWQLPSCLHAAGSAT